MEVIPLPPADDYPSVEDGPEVEHRVRGSRFLGRAFHVRRASEAAVRVREVRRAHHAARHHAWASRIGPPNDVVERADDDGEPSGTAGRPILQCIGGRSLSDVLLVVTRYFGGTKLGTGGLARAYADAARLALDGCVGRVVEIDCTIEIVLAYADLGFLEAALARSIDGIRRVSREYDPSPRIRLAVRPTRAAGIAASIIDATGGRASVSLVRSALARGPGAV
ncbi:MAG TPA: YigZ family protein [Candidatus Polarisedimenticolaceae bacterium]|nr:YigZ family protein [Candidatus Polarisedimenticolaceae bacterium]